MPPGPDDDPYRAPATPLAPVRDPLSLQARAAMCRRDARWCGWVALASAALGGAALVAAILLPSEKGLLVHGVLWPAVAGLFALLWALSRRELRRVQAQMTALDARRAAAGPALGPAAAPPAAR